MCVKYIHDTIYLTLITSVFILEKLSHLPPSIENKYQDITSILNSWPVYQDKNHVSLYAIHITSPSQVNNLIGFS